MFDLADAVHALTGLMAALHERRDIGDVHAECFDGRVLHFFHAFERGPEGAPEHVTAVLAVGDDAEAEVGLRGDNILDGRVFEGFELGIGFILFVACVEEVLGALEGA